MNPKTILISLAVSMAGAAMWELILKPRLGKA
jgi:hypothetical protein